MAELVLFDSDILIDVLRKNTTAEALLSSLGSTGPLGKYWNRFISAFSWGKVYSIIRSKSIPNCIKLLTKRR